MTAFDYIEVLITPCMCPATQHQLSVKFFHVLIDLISIGLNGTLEVMQQHHGRFL